MPFVAAALEDGMINPRDIESEVITSLDEVPERLATPSTKPVILFEA